MRITVVSERGKIKEGERKRGIERKDARIQGEGRINGRIMKVRTQKVDEEGKKNTEI